jgi:hypothetical protein
VTQSSRDTRVEQPRCGRTDVARVDTLENVRRAVQQMKIDFPAMGARRRGVPRRDRVSREVAAGQETVAPSRFGPGDRRPARCGLPRVLQASSPRVSDALRPSTSPGIARLQRCASAFSATLRAASFSLHERQSADGAAGPSERLQAGDDDHRVPVSPRLVPSVRPAKDLAQTGEVLDADFPAPSTAK